MPVHRILAPTMLVVASLWGNAAIASQSCDPRVFSMYYAAEKSAWDADNYPKLNALNLEHAKLADACGHRKDALSGPLLQDAASLYQGVGLVEFSHHKYAPARKHLERSNAIFHELQRAGIAPRPDAMEAAVQRNNETLAKIPKGN